MQDVLTLVTPVVFRSFKDTLAETERHFVYEYTNTILEYYIFVFTSPWTPDDVIPVEVADYMVLKHWLIRQLFNTQ